MVECGVAFIFISRIGASNRELWGFLLHCCYTRKCQAILWVSSNFHFDNFKVSITLFPKSSLRVCYMFPPGLLCGSCEPISSIRTIHLTVMVYLLTMFWILLSHMVKWAADMFIGENAEGRSIWTFLDVCSLPDDYLAAPQVIDVMRQSAGEPCTLCTFQYQFTHRVREYSNQLHVSSGPIFFTPNLNS